MSKSPLKCHLDENDAVVTGEPNCTLTPAQKFYARANMGAVATVNGASPDSSGNVTVPTDDTDAVRFTSQTLTDSQKSVARTNIAALAADGTADKAVKDADGNTISTTYAKVFSTSSSATPLALPSTAKVGDIVTGGVQTITYNGSTYNIDSASNTIVAGMIVALDDMSGTEIHVIGSAGGSGVVDAVYTKAS